MNKNEAGDRRALPLLKYTEALRSQRARSLGGNLRAFPAQTGLDISALVDCGLLLCANFRLEGGDFHSVSKQHSQNPRTKTDVAPIVAQAGLYEAR